MRNAKKVIRVTAGCLMILLAVGIPVTNLFLSSKDDDLLIENNISNIQADASSSIRKEMMQDNSADLEDINGELQKEETRIDVPVSINPGSTGALVPYEAVWGGSYPDETGQWVVLLTENTAENQEKVFALNPSLTESNTVFKTATFSLAYLENLMESINQEIEGNEDMSFVFSVGLREEKNCIQVDVTTDDPESIAKILSFDTIGGAIDIVNINDFVAPEEAQKGRMP